jgi:hypothetical protein
LQIRASLFGELVESVSTDTVYREAGSLRTYSTMEVGWVNCYRKLFFSTHRCSVPVWQPQHVLLPALLLQARLCIWRNHLFHAKNVLHNGQDLGGGDTRHFVGSGHWLWGGDCGIP